MVVEGAEYVECQNTGEVFNCLLAGMNNRHHGERAHTILSLLIEQEIKVGMLVSPCLLLNTYSLPVSS
jgi:hypothetical protein